MALMEHYMLINYKWMCSQIEVSNSHLQVDRAVKICIEECTIEQE